ncbi:MAG: esterase/lipase family protein [Candidatus Methylomirabilales bacterium]
MEDPVLVRRVDVAPWERCEAYQDRSDAFREEIFLPSQRRRDPVVARCFPDGGVRPHNGTFVLYFAPGWDRPIEPGAREPLPVLLVHGAGVDVQRTWVDPMGDGVAKTLEGNEGLLPSLLQAKLRVFAVQFAHPHGDNFQHSEQVANAIRVVRRRLAVLPGYGERPVSIVSHSMGTLPVWMYLSDAWTQWPKDPRRNWMGTYRGDVARWILLAPPLGGVDTMFRYYQANLAVYQSGRDAPVAFSEALIFGLRRGFGPETIGGEGESAYPGQRQVLFPWVDFGVPFTAESSTCGMQAFTCGARDDLYYGCGPRHERPPVAAGECDFYRPLPLLGPVVRSRGIYAAMRAGGDVIPRLNGLLLDHPIRRPTGAPTTGTIGLPPTIEATLLYGVKATVGAWCLFLACLELGDRAAPSDGLVYVASALRTEGLTRRGVALEVEGLELNHWELLFHPEAVERVRNRLLGQRGEPPAVQMGAEGAELTWAALAGTGSTVLEVSSDPALRGALRFELSSPPFTFPLSLSPGRYYYKLWRALQPDTPWWRVMWTGALTIPVPATAE